MCPKLVLNSPYQLTPEMVALAHKPVCLPLLSETDTPIGARFPDCDF